MTGLPWERLLALQESRDVDALQGYRRIVPWVGARLAGTTPEQLHAPTPCSEWDVADLLSHLLATSTYYALLAECGHVDVSGLPAPNTAPDYIRLYRETTDRALDAWAIPGVLDRPCTHAIAGAVPGFYALSIHAADALVHGWDLAVATGQNPVMDPAAAQFALDTFQVVLARDKARRSLFGVAVSTVAGDAQSSLLAFTGRVAPPPS